MTTDDMLKRLHGMKVSAEAINAELKQTYTPNEKHDWDNLWIIAHVTSGKMVTDIIMLTNLLQRVNADSGHNDS